MIRSDLARMMDDLMIMCVYDGDDDNEKKKNTCRFWPTNAIIQTFRHECHITNICHATHFPP